MLITVKELSTALAKAQSEFKPVPKNRVVDFTHNGRRTHYRYADLQDVLSMTQPILAKNGLSVSQMVQFEQTQMYIETLLLHSSGEWLKSRYPIRTMQRNQDQGSEITYARRYAYSAMIGIHAEEDDDGAAANDAEPESKKVTAKLSTDDVPDFQPTKTATKKGAINEL